MRTMNRMALLLSLVLLIAGNSLPVFSLGLGDLKDKAEKKAEKRAEDKADKAMDDALDEAEGKGEKKEGEAQKTTAKSGAASQRPGQGVWLNYDFVPGDRVLFYEDFENDYIGDFPMRLKWVSGNMEVAAWNGSNYLRIPGRAEFDIALDQPLPERFTFEMGLHFPLSQYLHVFPCEDGYSGSHANAVERIELRRHNTGKITIRVFQYNGGQILDEDIQGRDEMVFRIMATERYLKLYIDETRVANIPSSKWPRLTNIRFLTWHKDRDPVFISDMRVAAGGRTILYRKLEEDGRVATRGIYFDSGSDVLRPESTPTLSDIANMLEEHESLRIKIEGHTDAVGDKAANQDLSKRRAQAVKNYLVEDRKIDASRLEIQGLGDTMPVDSNDSPEGRQNNRRVELVKL
jgi:OOP family OmpA-OmpF porin